MASIFSYEPDPPRVASPWLQNSSSQFEGVAQDGVERSHGRSNGANTGIQAVASSEDAGGLTRLQAEPQEGPVEYKLHLLLRPRRKFRFTSTGNQISGSRHSNYGVGLSNRSVSESLHEPSVSPSTSTPSLASTQQTRQHRLEQLTTQLLWRLQQSSPHHSSSATNIILPSLPEALPELQPPQQPSQLLHGLEESQGALYEIGVSDDGTLVGLAEDELEESINNLRAMAACLGCSVEVLRKKTVGECEWYDENLDLKKDGRMYRTGELFVAEALVKPYLHTVTHGSAQAIDLHRRIDIANNAPRGPGVESAGTEQLRITLAGPTMSGKSTLLGTLTTSTLDNGRGKSRLSMLKHRHEITSGVTSSVTQELIGYRDGDYETVDIVNYAANNVASWIDIHIAAAGNRLILISDSAGHPRYRRTTVKGLVGWAPNWTLLCVPADDTEDTGGKSGSTHASQQSLGSSVPDMDLSTAQMHLCLQLGVPMVIVITKLDLASRTGLKETLTKVLDALKTAGRKPAIFPNAPGTVSEEALQKVDTPLLDAAYKICLPLLNDPIGTVPIVLTSAVHGTGLQNLHALLHELPTLPPSDSQDRNEQALFYIEDVYSRPAETAGIIVSGRLRSGQVSVGSRLMIGPFSVHDMFEDSEDSDERPRRRSSSHLPTSRSFPGALPHTMPSRFQLPNTEWRPCMVTSIRNLRLPVHTLLADQVGTVAILPDDTSGSASPSTTLTRIRKGMVLSNIQPVSTRTFTAEFRREDVESMAVGTHVVVYVASVRASAKIVSARAPDSPPASRDEARHGLLERNGTSLSDDTADPLDAYLSWERVAGKVTASSLLVTLSFVSSREYVVNGDQVLIMPGGGPGLYGGHERGERGLAGLEGFVGTITETFA